MTAKRASRKIALTLSAALFTCAGQLLAEDAKPAAPSTKTSQKSTAQPPVEAGQTGQTGKDLKLGEVEIRGELEKPKLFFILPKAERQGDTKERRLRFFPDILEPLDKDRFEEEARVLYQHGVPAE